MDNNFVRTQFYEFGKHMYGVAIATVLTIIPPISAVAGIVALVFIFLALADIKRLNFQLNNPNLELFRSKYITYFIYTILAVILFVVGGVNLAISLIYPGYGYMNMGVTLPLAIILLVAGFVMLISASVMEMKAWENLKLFFQQNEELFPDNLRHDIIDGSDNLRTGALLFALGFLVITLIVGFIFKIIGYFKLAKLKTIIYQQQPKEDSSQYKVQYQQPAAQNSQQTPSVEQAVEKPVQTSSFCPNCGAKLSRGGRFCPLCGSQVND
ncbi:MAG: zinc-ribbon domain-containing protein [Candidatus Hermodarchaeota archaeon]